MNKNIKKLVLTTAGLTLGMFAVGNMSAENNVAYAQVHDLGDGWTWDDAAGYGGLAWNPGTDGKEIKDVTESGRTLTGKLFFSSASHVGVVYLTDTEIHGGTITTDSQGNFSLIAPQDIPAGSSVTFTSTTASGEYAPFSVTYILQKGLILEDNGGDVTPEPEKPTPTPDFSTNTWEQNGSDWYCYDSNGAMITGWMQDGNNWYYFNQDGTMHKGWLESNGLWYSFRDNGQMKRGWEKINGTQYFFTDSGRLAYDEWLPYGSDWFYVNKKGRMLQNEWQPYNGSWFYFDAKGAMVTNQYVGGSYVDASGRAI